MRARLTLPQLWLVLAWLLPALASLLSPLAAVDLAYALRAGSAMLAGGGIPTVDSWTYTIAGQPWLDQQWGAQAVLAAAWQAAGWDGLVLLRAVLIGGAWAALVVALRRTAPGVPARVVALGALAAFVVAAPALALRPQLFGVAAFCLVLALLAGRRAHRRAAWLVPVVVAAWANLHGSFVLGPALVGLAWLEDLRTNRPAARRTLALGVIAAAAMVVTPTGPGALLYALRLSANRELAARVTEWQPPTLGDVPGALFYLSLVAVVAVLAWRAVRGRRVPATPGAPGTLLGRRLPATPATLLGLAVFAGLGLVAARGVAWWPALAVVALAGWPGVARPSQAPTPRAAPDVAPEPGEPPGRLAPAPAGGPSRRAERASWLNTAVVALLVAAGLLTFAGGRRLEPGTDIPAGLLAQAPPGVSRTLGPLRGAADRLWTPQPWASWFELDRPDLPVEVDSRIELFDAATWADYDTVADARPGWGAILDRLQVTIVVAAPDMPALRAALLADPGWRALPGVPAEGIVFVRAGRPGAPA